MYTTDTLGSSVGPVELFLAAAGAAGGNVDVIRLNAQTNERGIGQHLEVDMPLGPFLIEIIRDLVLVDLKEDLLDIIIGLEAAAADTRTSSVPASCIPILSALSVSARAASVRSVRPMAVMP